MFKSTVNVVVLAYNPSIQETEVGYCKFEASLGSIVNYIPRPCLQKTNNVDR